MKMIFRFLLLFAGFLPHVYGGITFGSMNSAIKIANGATFHLGHDLSNVDGMIFKENSATVSADSGKIIRFSRGMLESNSVEMVLTASYNPNLSGETIELSGNHSLRAEPGTILQQVNIANSDNRITGQPLFLSPITFETDSNTTLTIAIHSKLNQDVQLNTGTLFLEHDLELGDGVKITGAGVVKLNNKSFSFGSEDLSLSDNIYWDNAGDIYLNGKVSLSGIWTFSGTSILNGNGNILDLTSGGTLRIDPASTLYLTNLVIKGLGKGRIEFLGDDSRIYMSNVNVELATSYTTTIGGIYVEGPTTFILQDKSWLFDQNASLTVDGVVLWTDRRGTPTEDRGYVLFGTPTVDYFTSINSGTIKEKVYLSDVESLEQLVNKNTADIIILDGRMDTAEVDIVNNSNAIVATNDLTLANSGAVVWLYDNVELKSLLIAGPLTSDITLDKSEHIHPDDQVIIAGDLTINGSGAMLVFSDGKQPQFVVQQGKTVTLKNINLQNITAKTFQCASCSKVVIGDNVTLGLSDDVALPAHFEVTGSNFNIEGVGGRRKVSFANSSACCACDLLPIQPLYLGSKTLSLKHVELTSIKTISFGVNGKLLLNGDATVVIDENSDHNFMVQGTENELRLVMQNPLFSGTLRFGDTQRNMLRITSKIKDSESATACMTFADNFAHVLSTGGLAELIFDSDFVSVYNEGYNSFVLGQNAFLDGKNLELINKPIRKISNTAATSSALALSGEGMVAESGFYSIPLVQTAPEAAPNPLGYRTDGEPLYIRSPQLMIDEPRVIVGSEIVTILDKYTVHGKWIIEKNAHLVFEFDEKTNDQKLYFAADCELSLNSEACIEFKGKGSVVWDENAIILISENFEEKPPVLVIGEGVEMSERIRSSLLTRFS